LNSKLRDAAEKDKVNSSRSSLIWQVNASPAQNDLFQEQSMTRKRPSYAIEKIANLSSRALAVGGSHCGQQSCTAGRAAFITGQSPIRTGLTKVGLPGADIGLRAEDPSVAELLKPLGYATGQFGKNHLGDGRISPHQSRIR
jgi:hypothetical protein